MAEHLATATQRAAAVQKRDEAMTDAFRDAILALCPAAPRDEVAQIARHSLKKHSRRVGRRMGTVALLRDRARLAVGAHIRHVHTDYDRLLKQGVSRQAAREQVWDQVRETARRWGCKLDMPSPPTAPARGRTEKKRRGKETAQVWKGEGKGFVKKAMVYSELKYPMVSARMTRSWLRRLDSIVRGTVEDADVDDAVFLGHDESASECDSGCSEWSSLRDQLRLPIADGET
jgi:hypothetical protein